MKLIALLFALAPWTAPRAVVHYAHAIATVTDDPNEQIALAVTAVRESNLSLGCPLGRGGAGGFQLNPRYYPMFVACGPLAQQAARALSVLRAGGLGRKPFRNAAGAYLGATSRHPEALRRESLYNRALLMYSCQCSML